MEYIVTESQKRIIINALRFAADSGNPRAAKEWSKLADYLEVLEPQKAVVMDKESKNSWTKRDYKNGLTLLKIACVNTHLIL